MRTWPALDVGPLNDSSLTGPPALPADASSSVGSGVGQPDLFQAALTEYQIAAVDECSDDRWRVFFQTAAERDRAAATLRTTFRALRIEPVDVPDEDWAARSQADLHAVHVGDIVVTPPWDATANSSTSGASGSSRIRDRIVIVIQPSMGFGTGHHATTRLCLAALQRIEVRGRSVIDVGCGSGVLAIAASLLGGVHVVGIDDDPDAIQAARENAAMNPDASLSLRTGDLATTNLVAGEVVLANLTGGLLVSASNRLRQLTARQGRLILSGFLSHEEPAVLAAYAGMRVEHRAAEDGWLCVTLEQRAQERT